jgi:hypothetical protein
MGGGTAILIPSGLTQMPVIRGFVIRNSGDGIQSQSEFIAEFNYFHSSVNLTNYQMGGGGTNRNNVYFNSSGDAIHVDNMNRPLLIENNRIMYAGEDGIEINLQNTSIPPSLVEVDIWNNMIIGSEQDAIQFVDYTNDPQDVNRRFVIVGNLIANNKKAGIGLTANGNMVEDYSGADTLEALRVFNNTFYGNDYGISGGDNLLAFNNIIVNSLGRAVWNVQGASGANSVIAYTLFNGNKIDAEQSTIGTGVISGLDPLFEAPPNPGPDGTWETVDDNFSGLLLRSGSPAIDRGITQYIAVNGEPVPPSPITGFTGLAPDLGWREFGSPAFITPTPTTISSPTPSQTITPLTPTLATTPTATPASPTPGTVTSTPASPTPASTSTSTPGTPTSTSTPAVTPTTGNTATLAPIGIQEISPNIAEADTTVSLTISGSGFADGATVTLEGGQGLASEVVAVQVVDAATIIATVNVKADAAFGTQLWDIRVTNPDGVYSVLVDGFTVNP